MMGKNPKRVAQQAKIGQYFHHNIDECPQPPAEHDDPQPVHVRAPADEVHHRDQNKNQPKTIVSEKIHGSEFQR
jgi:hypothetical protein